MTVSFSSSAIVTTHNRPNKLRRALASIGSQTCLPSEVVVVDDGSRPPIDSSEIQKSFKCIDIVFVRNEQSQGPGGARNRGVEASSGDVVMFLDDDDTWEPRKVERQLNTFDRLPEVGLVYSGRLIVSHVDRSQVLYRVGGECEGDIFPGILFKNCIGVTSSVALRRSVFDRVNGFDEEQPARIDYEMWIRCAKVTNVAPDGGFGLRYTVTSSSGDQVSHSPVERHVRAVRRIMEKHVTEIQELGVLDERKVRAEHLYYVAKMARRHSLAQAAPWMLRSLTTFPLMKTVLLMLSPHQRRRLRSFLAK